MNEIIIGSQVKYYFVIIIKSVKSGFQCDSNKSSKIRRYRAFLYSDSARYNCFGEEEKKNKLIR